MMLRDMPPLKMPASAVRLLEASPLVLIWRYAQEAQHQMRVEYTRRRYEFCHDAR